MNEKAMDALLNIQTAEEHNFSHSIHYHRYEATPYLALGELFASFSFPKDARVVDFGCGKGRFLFYLNYYAQVRGTGVEMDERLFRAARRNLERFVKRNPRAANQIRFIHSLAEDYHIQPEENYFYFFNPFSDKIFYKVVNNILLSIERFQREVVLILYYPPDGYIAFLESMTPFYLYKEIPVAEWYGSDANERFLLYRFRNNR
jgi:Methionine biosynthesis protein MetW.